MKWFEIANVVLVNLAAESGSYVISADYVLVHL